MQQSRPPISGKTRFYGVFADPVEHLQAPAVLNALLDRRGVDAIFIPLHVTAEHLTVTVAGMRHLRNFAGYGVSMPHKSMAARLCDALLPNAQACGVVNNIRVDADGRWIGEILDGVGMVRAITAQRALDANSRVLLVGAVEARNAFDPAPFDIVINATSLGLNGQGPLPVEVARVSETALVAEVVMAPEVTPLLQAAQTRGLGIVRGREMLTQQLAAIVDFFGMTV
jgi:shikimate dehydrogenase